MTSAPSEKKTGAFQNNLVLTFDDVRGGGGGGDGGGGGRRRDRGGLGGAGDECGGRVSGAAARHEANLRQTE